MSADQLREACRFGDVDTVRGLLATCNAETINSIDDQGKTALFWAAYSDVPELVKVLVEAGAKLDLTTPDDQWTALHWSAYGGQTEGTKALLECGADHAAKDSNGASALHIAAEQGYPEVVQALLAAGADPAQKDNDGKTALHACVKRWSYMTEDDLMEDYHRNRAKGYAGVVKVLLAARPDLADVTNNDGETPATSIYARHGGIAAAINRALAGQRSSGGSATLADGTIKDLSFADGVLYAKALNDMGEWVDAELDLNYELSNQDGDIRPWGSRFMDSCSDVILSGTVLEGMAKTRRGSWNNFFYDLDGKVANSDGILRFSG